MNLQHPVIAGLLVLAAGGVGGASTQAILGERARAEVDSHDSNEAAHAVKHTRIQSELGNIRNSQTYFRTEIEHITEELDDAKQERKQILDVLRSIERRDR